MNKLWCGGSVVVLLLSCALFGCGSVAMGEEATAEIEAPIQNSLIGFQGVSSPLGWATLLHSDSQSAAGKITGALRYRGSDNLFYSCGVTFISKSYALTAAHCVPTSLIPLSFTYRVEQYNTRDIALFQNSLALLSSMTVTGTQLSNWMRPDPLTAAEGYVVSTYSDCFTFVACHSDFARTDNCPFSKNVDIALIRCFSRRSSPLAGNFTSVNTVDPEFNQVEVWWFHELLNLADDLEDQNTSQPPNNYQNYGALTANSQNYHYTNPNHQLLPFRSTSWPNGTFYKQLGHWKPTPTSDEETKTDVPVCHGTSGSGVFSRGTTNFIGVVSDWGRQSVQFLDPAHQRLCEDMDNKSANMDLMHHTRAPFARQLESMALTDRQ